MYELIIAGVSVFLCVYGGGLIFKYYHFRRSIYKEIYSNFLEYQFKHTSIKKLSTSYWYEQLFGTHRITYSLIVNTDTQVQEAYVILLLSSGVYLINVKNNAGKIMGRTNGNWKNIFIHKGKRYTNVINNPIREIMDFGDKLTRIIGIESDMLHRCILFPDNSDVLFEGKGDDVLVFKRSQLTKEILSIHHDNNMQRLKNEQIFSIFNQFINR